MFIVSIYSVLEVPPPKSCTVPKWTVEQYLVSISQCTAEDIEVGFVTMSPWINMTPSHAR